MAGKLKSKSASMSVLDAGWKKAVSRFAKPSKKLVVLVSICAYVRIGACLTNVESRRSMSGRASLRENGVRWTYIALEAKLPIARVCAPHWAA